MASTKALEEIQQRQADKVKNDAYSEASRSGRKVKIFFYKGYKLYNSPATGNWWVEDTIGHMRCWAQNEEDGKKKIDDLSKAGDHAREMGVHLGPAHTRYDS